MKTKNKLLIMVVLAIIIISIVAASILDRQENEFDIIKPEKYIFSTIYSNVADTLFEKELKEFLKTEQPSINNKEYMVFLEMSPQKCKLYYTYDAFQITERSNVFFFKYDNKIMAASNIANNDITIPKEYVWSVLKDVFPSQYQLYQQGRKKTTDTIMGNIWYFTFRYVHPHMKVKRVIKQEKIW